MSYKRCANEHRQNGHHDEATHKKVGSLNSKFIDNVAVGKERAVLGF